MSPFQRAIEESAKLRAIVLGPRANNPVAASEIIALIPSTLGLAIETVPDSYETLGTGAAVLVREELTIYVRQSLSAEDQAGLIAHELGHWKLDADKTGQTIANLAALQGLSGSPAVIQVEAYGAREREELQANVFGREFLLPRLVARGLFSAGCSPETAAKRLGVPGHLVRQQYLDAILLPDYVPTPQKPIPVPSPDQKKASEAKERFANVVAGPGTGKTSTLIQRVKYLIEEKSVDPSHILVLTFTNKAAFELVERLRSANIARASDIWAGTFHAFGLEFIRKLHQKFDLEADVVVADKLHAVTLLYKVLPKLSLKYFRRIEDPYEWLGDALRAIKRLKEELVSPEEYRQRIADLHKAVPTEDGLRLMREDVAIVYEAYESVLKEVKLVDFVDLVGKPTRAMKADRAVFSELADKFQYVLVDEYQDVTFAMVELLREISKKAKSLWVVGDVRQAIHHWRGASVKSLIKFSDTFRKEAGGQRMQKYPLTINRRSSQEILDVVHYVGKKHILEAELPLDAMTADKGVSGNKAELVKCLERAAIAPAIAGNIVSKQQAGIPFCSQAVLCRRGNDVDRMAAALRYYHIPVLYIGELAHRPEVKRLLCLMQLLVERQPRALVGLIGIPSLSMTMQDINVLIDACKNSVRLQRGRWIHNPPPGLSAQAVNVVATLKKLIGFADRNTTPFDFVCKLVLEDRVGLPALAGVAIDDHLVRLALWQFAHAVKNGDGEKKYLSLTRYLLRQQLRQKIGENYVDRELPPEVASLDAVRLLTTHGSKGLEFDYVHVGYIEAYDYAAPRQNWMDGDSIVEMVPPEVLNSNLEEFDKECAIERNNLLYVAVSRARTRLSLYWDGSRDDQLPEQVKPIPASFLQLHSPAKPILADASAGQGVLAQKMTFAAFERYERCPRQYWYRHGLGLNPESDANIAVRAQWAVMESLQAVASGSLAPQAAFDASWEKRLLPDQSEDPGLWKDAWSVFSGGIDVFGKLPGAYAELEGAVDGVPIGLPWGKVEKVGANARINILRLSKRGISVQGRLMRPVLAGVKGHGYIRVVFHPLLDGDAREFNPSNAVESTNAYKAIQKFKAGDVAPRKDRHCAHCPYMSICPELPSG